MPAAATRPAVTTGTASSAATPRTGRSRRERSSAATARAAPAAATASPSSGGPPREASGSGGPAAGLKAGRPHGNPPHGHEDRIHSQADHDPATPATAPGARGPVRDPGATPHARITTAPAPKAATYNASTTARPHAA